VAFGDPGFPDVQQQLGLTLAETDLFAGVPPLSARDGQPLGPSPSSSS
jgi:hypothetical protein